MQIGPTVCTIISVHVAGQRVEVEYKGIVQPIILSVVQNTAAIVYNIECEPALISYLHTTSGLLVKETWLAGICKR